MALTGQTGLSPQMRKFLLISVIAVVSAFVFVPAASASSDANQRVIVELALPANAAADQIAATADAVIAELPTGSYSVTNRYSLIPYLGLSVSPAALAILNSSSSVTAVHRDEVVSAAPSAPAAVAGGVKGKKAKKCKKSKTKAGKKKYKACKKASKK